MPKTETPKSVDASVVEDVLAEISRDRRAAHADLDRVVREMQNHLAAVNEANQAVVIADIEAEADVKAHQRFEKRMKRPDFDARKRVLDRVRADAQAKLRAARQKVETDVAPYQHRLQAAQQKVKELAQEWAAHQRIAKAAGVDVAAYWTPESGVPAAQPEEAVSAMVVEM